MAADAHHILRCGSFSQQGGNGWQCYHLSFDPPPADVAPRLVQRADDTEEKCRERLDVYHAQTAPLVPFYEGLGLLRRVDGVGEPDAVTARIVSALA